MMRCVTVMAVLVGVCLAGGCSKRVQLEYGEPVAQFLQDDLIDHGEAYVGKKISVKGYVESVDLGDPAASWVFLEGGIRCNMKHLKAMAESCKPGEEVFVDGILKRFKDGEIILQPAVLRDPTATFSPWT